MSRKDLLRGEGFHGSASYVPAGHGPRGSATLGSGGPTSAATSPRSSSFSWMRTPIVGSLRDPRRLLRAVRHRAGPSDPRPEGKTVGVARADTPPHAFLASVAAYVGVDPRGRRVGYASVRRVDATPGAGERSMRSSVPSRATGAAREAASATLLVNGAVDRPWSQYFCCMAVANQDFARKYPVAAKRALRAILKAADICALDPDRAASPYRGPGCGETLRSGPPDHEGRPLHQVAELRPRRHDSLLRPAPAKRSG